MMNSSWFDAFTMLPAQGEVKEIRLFERIGE
jgi:hypothetical protein